MNTTRQQVKPGSTVGLFTATHSETVKGRRCWHVECPECGWKTSGDISNIKRRKTCGGCGRTTPAVSNSVTFTCITSDTPDLCKTISTNGSTQPGTVKSGRYKTYSKTMLWFYEWLFRITQHQCVVTGTPKYESGRVTIKAKLPGQPETTIALSKDHLRYTPGQPALMLLDTDHSDKSWADIDQAIDSILAGYSQAERVVTASSSAGLIEPDGTPRDGGTSRHVWLCAADGSDIPRATDVLKHRLILAGYGHVEISNQGHARIKTLIDDTVGQPYRLVYEAPPILLGGLTQDRPAPQYYPGTVVDTATALPDLTEDELLELEQVKQKLLDDAEPERLRMYDKYVQQYAADNSIMTDEAKRIIDLRSDRKLDPEDTIRTGRNDYPLVREIIAAPDAWHGKTCCDPQEPDYKGYHPTVAKIYHNDDRSIVIHSFAHGENAVYYLRHAVVDLSGFGEHSLSEEEPLWDFDDLEYYIPRIDGSECLASDKSAFVEDIVKHIDHTNAVAWDVVKKLIKGCLGVNMGAVDATLKRSQKVVRIGDEGDNRTHAELAEDFASSLDQSKNVACDGFMWRYNEGSGIFHQHELAMVEAEVGGKYTGSHCKRFSDYRGIAKLVYTYLLKKDFFRDAPYGVACKSKFYSLEGDQIVARDYEPSLKQRHKLAFDPLIGAFPLFTKLLSDSFAGDDQVEQTLLFQEIMGGLATGDFHRIQRAILLYGSGENGKSAILELLSYFFPPSMRCAISPSDFGNEYYIAQLAGKVVNIVGELQQTKALPSASFKDMIGCDTEVTGRHIRQDPFTFKPVAGHIFSSNHLPQTKDHTHGFYRRWSILHFRNKVREKIPNFGEKIAREEAPQVLAWALEGAKRLAGNGFQLTKTKAHNDLLDKWQVQKDSVYSFLFDEEEVCHSPDAKVGKKELYEGYKRYCKESGVMSVGRNHFYERCLTKVGEKKINGVRCFVGLDLTQQAIRNAFQRSR